MHTHFAIIFAVANLLLSNAGAAARFVGTPDSLSERFDQLHARWVSQAEQLATKCEAQGQTEEMVRRYRHLIPDQQRQAIELFFTRPEMRYFLVSCFLVQCPLQDDFPS